MAEMTIDRTASGETLEMAVAGSLTIAQAADFKVALMEALEAPAGVRVDLSRVEAMDLSALQLLCAAHGSAREKGKSFALSKGGSEVFNKTVSDAGFQRHVGCLRDESQSCIWVGGDC